MLVFLFALMVAPNLVACNIPETELVLRLAVIKAEEARQMNMHGYDSDTHDENSNISKKEFNKLIDSVKKVYGPIFKKQRLNFRIETSWSEEQTNAFAGVRGEDRYVLIYGGYARHPLMTEDAFLSVVCHEIGHHLGGFPRKTSSPWSSSEGQADYFSTLKCMKEVLRESDDNESKAALLDLPDVVKKDCRSQYPKDADYWICLRSAKAADDYGKVMVDLTNKGGAETSLLTPSTQVLTTTNLKHPDSQCRVDTKYQGALCNVSTAIPLDPVDETRGACHVSKNNKTGSRPACWFVHKK